MPTYIVLGNFTDQGIRSVRDSLKREDAFRKQCEKVGARVTDVYRTMGRYDLAAVQAMQNKTTQALDTLRSALQQSSQRLEHDPKAANLYSNALGDSRFAALRSLPDFAKLLDSFKPK